MGRDLFPERTPGADGSTPPTEKGCLAPSPIPIPARSAHRLSGTTLIARLVAALTLGSPASGIRVPISDPARACAGVGGEAGAAAPPPPALDSAQGNPEGKERGGGAQRLETPSSGGSPPARQSFAPSPLPTLGGSDGGGSCQAQPGQRRERAGAGGCDPRGGKLGGGRQKGLRPGRGCRALAHLLVPRLGPRDGRLRVGADSAQRGAHGTRRSPSGPGGAIPASHGRRRRLGSASQLGLWGSAGGAG